MQRQSRWRAGNSICQCHQNTPHLSILLFLSLILPSSSFAQLTSTNYPPPGSETPTTLSTITTPSMTDSPSSAETSAPPSTKNNPVTFNYYLVIVVIFALLFFVAVLYFGRQKRRKAALIRVHGQNALARDVQHFAEFRQRFGPRLGGGMAIFGGGRGEGSSTPRVREDGLDERGEAPPAYNAEDKPPSIGHGGRVSTEEVDAEDDVGERTVEMAAHPAENTYARGRSGTVEVYAAGEHGMGTRRSGESVEMKPLSKSRSVEESAIPAARPSQPPHYEEATGSGESSVAEVTRPEPVVTATERGTSTGNR